WAAKLSTVLCAAKPETTVETAKDVVDAEDRIRAYFEAANDELGFLDVLCSVAIPAAVLVIVASLLLVLQAILSHKSGGVPGDLNGFLSEPNGPLAYAFRFCI